jgi:hypothetical protein
MKRYLRLAVLLLITVAPAYATSAEPEPQQRKAWYERALNHVNPTNQDYGAIWEDRKRQFIDQLGNPYFQYGMAVTGALVLLLTLVAAQYMSHRRVLQHAARSIADVIAHDRYARKTAQEAIHRHNTHMESCNRMIEASRERASRPDPAVTSQLQRMSEELLATREENKALREEDDKKSRMIAEMSLQMKKRGQSNAQIALDFVPPDHIARINELEKQLAAEKEKNQRRKGTPVDAHRA